MIRNIKTLGLATMAILAMSAAAASTALAAQGKLTTDGPVTLKTTEWSTALTLFGSSSECFGSTWTGHKYNATPHEMIPSGSTTVTVTTDYNQPACLLYEASTHHKLTMTSNGCDFVLHLGEAFGGVYNVSTDIVCPGEKDIQMDVYAFAGSELGGVACTMTIKSQSGLTGPILRSNTISDELEIEGTFKGIKASRSGFGCATAETSAGELHSTLFVQGRNSEGALTGVTVTN